jgi:hypothetical protein
MGPTLLIACLWGAVLVYWFWSRRPLGDPVGSFRNELRVLGSATPGRVAPANRLAPAPTVLVSATEKKLIVLNEMVGPPVPLTAAARTRNRQELRRRRRDVIAVLALAALVSLFAAVLTSSALFVVLHVLIDLALVTYVYLLARTSGGPAKASRPSFVERGDSVAPPPVSTVSTVRLGGASYIRGRTLVDVDWSEPSYGDFGSYAELAMSRGN